MASPDWANHNTDGKDSETKAFLCSEELNTLWKTATCRLLVPSREEALVVQTEPDRPGHLRRPVQMGVPCHIIHSPLVRYKDKF